MVLTWEAVLAGLRPGQNEDDENPVEPKHGWQKPAARAMHEHRVARVVWPNLTDPERALWRSQSGPLASNVLVSVDSDRPAAFPRVVLPPSPPSSSLLLPHLPMWPSPRLPWPPSSSVRGGGFPGSKLICTGATNVMVRKARRLEIVVDGLTDHLRRRSVGHRHHHGVPFAAGRDGSQEGGGPQWRSIGRRSEEEEENLPRVGGGARARTPRRVGC